MVMIKKLVGMMKKQQASPPSPDVSKAENPYLAARRTWNEHVGEVVQSRQTWQLVGVLSLLIALAAVGGIAVIGAQSKFQPYVVEVDKLGQFRVVSVVERAIASDTRNLESAVQAFVENARLVTPDTALQRKAIFAVYAMLNPQDAAAAKMNEFLNGTEALNPFRRAAREVVSIDIDSVLRQTDATWQVDWVETTNDRQGAPIGAPARYRALLTVYQAPPDPGVTEEQFRRNPFGIYVRDYSWSRVTQ
jgi:type IV secretion system protein VirB5